MSFRFKQKYRSAPCSAVCGIEQKTLETGVVENKAYDACSLKLPDPELFELEDNLKTGTNLKEVSSKVLGGSSINLGEFISENDESNNNNKKDVNDEN